MMGTVSHGQTGHREPREFSLWDARQLGPMQRKIKFRNKNKI